MTRSCSYSVIEELINSTNLKTNLNTKQLAAVGLALDTALKSKARYKVGCTIMSSSGFYTGESSTKSHPMQLRYGVYNKHKIYLHAEISALSKIKKKERLYCAAIARVTCEGHGNSAPCDSCLAALMAFKVENVIFYKENTWNLIKLGE